MVAGVFQVPRAMNAALSCRNVLCASGYSVAAVAPAGIIPLVNRSDQAVIAVTKSGSVHDAFPSMASYTLPGAMLLISDRYTSVLTQASLAPCARHLTLWAFSVAQSSFHCSKSVGTL